MAARQVVWTATAIRQRREILRFWTEKNGSTVFAKKLVEQIRERTSLIADFPESGRQTEYKQTRVAAMGNFSIIYRPTGQQIIVMAFWDNRQDPEKLLEILRLDHP